MMRDLSPKPSDLDPIEIASRDEIAALQLDRLRWSLGHAYDQRPHYRQAFDAAGVHPDDLQDLSDLAKFPFTVKQDLRDNYPFGMFAVPREQDGARPRLLRHHRQTHRRRLHRPGHRHLGQRRRAVHARRRDAAAGTWCMWPMATASSPAASARITARKNSAALSFPSRAA
jgi:hypothetical protein